MKKITPGSALLFISLMVVPVSVLAVGEATQVTNGLGEIKKIIDSLGTSVLRSLITLFATAALAGFFFGVVQFILGSRDGKPEVMSKGKNFMLWGLIALFVMFSVWGIVSYAQKLFGVTQTTITIPSIDIQQGSPSPSPASGGLPVSPTPSPSVDSSNCAGKSEGTACTVSGRAGSCTTNDDGTFGCYAIPSSGGQGSCPSGQVLGADGSTCTTPRGSD